MGNYRILLQVYFRTGILGAGIKIVDLSDPAECYAVVCLEKDCLLERIMDLAD